MTNAGRSRFIASQGGLPVVLYPTDQFPTIASIPADAVVYDTADGVLKRKIGGYLVDIQYNVIGYGPIADAPEASAGLLNSYFIQTDDPAWPNGRFWQAKSNGKLQSDVNYDTVDFNAPLSSDGLKQPWEIEFLFNVVGGVTGTTTFFRTGYTSNNFAIDSIITTSATPRVRWGNDAGTGIPINASGAFVGNGWHKMKVWHNGITGYRQIDNNDISERSLSTWNPVYTNNFRVGKIGISLTSVSICDFKASRNGVPLVDAPFNDLGGNIVTDKSGNNLNGVITDVAPTDFWQIDWIPVQW